jgi:hypothetical protein
MSATGRGISGARACRESEHVSAENGLEGGILPCGTVSSREAGSFWRPPGGTSASRFPPVPVAGDGVLAEAGVVEALARISESMLNSRVVGFVWGDHPYRGNRDPISRG